MIYLVLVAVVTIPLLAVGSLLLIGLRYPEVRRKGLRQLRQPFALRGGMTSAYELSKGRRSLEDEAIRRFGQPDHKSQPRD
ncbi:MAG TPA: hypothetical protein VMV96_06085 [Acidimicrobiales bacterium]|nr:hypothetical protein [Acidimicrobiales bacterium]